MTARGAQRVSRVAHECIAQLKTARLFRQFSFTFREVGFASRWIGFVNTGRRSFLGLTVMVLPCRDRLSRRMAGGFRRKMAQIAMQCSMQPYRSRDEWKSNGPGPRVMNFPDLL